MRIRLSDWGTCRDNLNEIESMLPLTDREDLLALMQFDYKTSADLDEAFTDHPVVIYWKEKGLI